MQCIDAVFEELQRIVLECELPEFQRFVNLRDSIFEVVKSVLKKCLQPANQMIVNLIQIELAYINTNHPDFIGGSNAIGTSLGHGYGPTAGASSVGGGGGGTVVRRRLGIGRPFNFST